MDSSRYACALLVDHYMHSPVRVLRLQAISMLHRYITYHVSKSRDRVSLRVQAMAYPVVKTRCNNAQCPPVLCDSGSLSTSFGVSFPVASDPPPPLYFHS